MRLKVLEKNNINLEVISYNYIENGGTKNVSNQLNIDEFNIIKTIIFYDANKPDKNIAALMHGNNKISTRKLEKISGIRHLKIASPEEVFLATGFKVGSVCPFLLKENIILFGQSSILDLPFLIVNGGKHNLLFKLKPNCFDIVECTFGNIKKKDKD